MLSVDRWQCGLRLGPQGAGKLDCGLYDVIITDTRGEVHGGGYNMTWDEVMREINRCKNKLVVT